MKYANITYTITSAMTGFSLLVSTAGAAPRSGAVGAVPAKCIFKDISGKSYKLLGNENLPAVYLFVGTNCPVANAYTPRIVSLAKSFRARGVHIFGVYPNSNETRQEIIKHASERAYSFPIVKDD